MTDKDWAKFFDLVGRIVNLELPVNEKTRLVCDKASENETDETNFEEFASWDFSVYQ